jgi:endonuclease/exonuclease/phosphatase family metal-dependent hydrolase
VAFKVMTWNLENLFRVGSEYGPKTKAVYQAKLSGLAATIDEESPDALAVQEVGDEKALDDLLKLLTGAWNKQVSQHPDKRGIRVAWLSRRKMTSTAEIYAFPKELAPVQDDDKGNTQGAMGRGAVAVTVRSDAGRRVRLVTTHLKSKLLTFPGKRFNPKDETERARYAAYALYRRAAEAATLRVWVTGELDPKGSGPPVLVCGDLNDTVQSATTQLLLGPPGSEIDTRGFKTPDKGDTQRLWNLAPLMPAGRNYSRINQGRPELIDHILVSDALVRKVAVNSVGAVLAEPLPSITPAPTARLNEPSSDQAPVVASFLV